jgi:hypothetical protein
MRTITLLAAKLMKRIGILVLVVALAGLAATVASQAAFRPGAKACGGVLWRMKTFSDRQRNLVRVNPRGTTIEDLSTRPYPTPLPRTRSTKLQRQTYTVVAQITEYRMDGNELRLVLFDHGAYMNAVIPAPGCLTRATRERAQIVDAWQTFVSRCGRPMAAWQPQGAVVYVTGVGFWSSRFKPRRGAARNGAELHPVTGFRSVAGCGG